jgi:PTH1 family peptidyl-tRNA hydrolase
MVLDELARRLGAGFKTHKANALIAEGRPSVPTGTAATLLRNASEPAGVGPGSGTASLGGPKLVLAKPGSFMNVSGKPVAALAKFFSIEPDHLIVVHDELDLPFDTVRLKLGGGAGGHNGVRDIINALGADFIRVRVGVGRPPGRQDAADFVLKDFSSTERAVLPNLVTDAADAVEAIVASGLAEAQQRFHSPS